MHYLFYFSSSRVDNLSTACFCVGCKEKNSFYMLNGWEKIWKKNKICEAWNSIKGHKNTLSGVFPVVVSWLRPHTPSAGGLGQTPGQRTRSYMQLRGAESSLGRGEKEPNYIFTEEKWQHLPLELSSQQHCHRQLWSQHWSSHWGGIRPLESRAPTLGGPALCAHLVKTWPSLLPPSWRPLHLDDW